MCQADLVAEVTRRPRRADSAPRLDPEGMYRVAVHEAGHTVARLVSSTTAPDLAFASDHPEARRVAGLCGLVAT